MPAPRYFASSCRLVTLALNTGFLVASSTASLRENTILLHFFGKAPEQTIKTLVSPSNHLGHMTPPNQITTHPLALQPLYFRRPRERCQPERFDSIAVEIDGKEASCYDEHSDTR